MSSQPNDAGRIYLDHASTSPLRASAGAAMAEWLDGASGGKYGDPSRMHGEAFAARAAIEEARSAVAGLFGARPREVVFTSGATESIAAAIHGAQGRYADADADTAVERRTQPHAVVVATEHAAVRLPSELGPHTIVDVDRHGRVDPVDIGAAIEPRTAIVHVQLGNHEVGTVHDIAAIAQLCRDLDVLLHVDAAQSAGRLPIEFAGSGIDLLSMSAHKMGGPTGVGALLIRRGLRIDPTFVGGDQERGRRAGMENTIGIVGFGATARELQTTLPAELAAAERQRAILETSLGSRPDVTVYGDPEHRLPHVLCLGLVGVEPQPVLIGLDNLGVSAHSGSSCSAEALAPSPVLDAMGADAQRSLRLSVGHSTTDAELRRAADILHRVLDDIARLGVQPRSTNPRL